MRAVFDRSWALLTRREQAICQGVSIFCGGFTWQAARQVADASLHDLRTLVDKSLLHRTVMDRFEMHELLRQYAEERLDQEPVASQATRDQHCAYYTSALQQWAMDLKGPRQQRALAEMDAEIENARMAWNWSVRQGQIKRLDQAMEGLCLFYTWRSRYEEGKAVCRAVVEGLQSAHKGWQAAAPDDGPRVQARALMWQSVFERELGCTDLADQLLGQGLALIEELEFFHHDIRAERASLLRRMGEMAYRSDLREAERLFEQSLALYRALGDRWGMANVLRALGSVALNAGDYGRAKQLYEESLAIRRALGDRWGTANSLQGLGRVALPLGEIESGERLVREGIASSEEIGDQAGIVKGLGNLGVLLSWSGRFTEAQVVLEKSMAICNDLGFQVGSLYAYAFLSSIKGYLGEYEPARALAQKSLALAREIGHSWSLGYSLMLLGGCALIENDYDRAWQFLQESLSVYRGIGQKDTAGLSLGLSVVAALRLGRVALARQYLCEALRMVAAIGAFEQAVSALAATALFLAERGQPEWAVELYATLSRYLPVTEGGWYKDLFGRHVAAAAAGLPPEAVAAARARGQERDLQATLAELLIELENREWDD
jgi:tetratricopeptide (TPR) repeat protein